MLMYLKCTQICAEQTDGKPLVRTLRNIHETRTQSANEHSSTITRIQKIQDGALNDAVRELYFCFFCFFGCFDWCRVLLARLKIILFFMAEHFNFPKY